ncbi:hypothetical protein BJ742DRAFT_782358 [Cladochytrium replicatum]|nr:hypothetical protein BJ742DRAFT_782358 [Cladochytrium replicatum]
MEFAGISTRRVGIVTRILVGSGLGVGLGFAGSMGWVNQKKADKRENCSRVVLALHHSSDHPLEFDLCNTEAGSAPATDYFFLP